VAFFGENSTAEEENSLVRASFSTESIVNSELTKNVGKSLGVAIGAGLVIELLTGLMNPILGIVTALGAITVGVFRSTQKIVPEIKDGIKKSVSEKLKADEGASSSKLKEEVKRIFGEYREQLLQALEQKFAQAQKDIDNIVDTLKKDKYAIDQKMTQLSHLEERAQELRQKTQNFIGDI
jgi:flagellar motility protein MotE (MotC chaperone)